MSSISLKVNPFTKVLAGMQCGLAAAIVIGPILLSLGRTSAITGFLIGLACALILSEIEGQFEISFFACFVLCFNGAIQVILGKFSDHPSFGVLALLLYTLMYLLVSICEKRWREHDSK